MHVWQKAVEISQVGAVFERFFFDLGSGFGAWQAPQTFRGLPQLPAYIGKVPRFDSGTVPSFRTETNQRSAQIFVHLTQGFEVVARRHPWKSIPPRTDAGSEAL